mgnify:CR=1 FL=1
MKKRKLDLSRAKMSILYESPVDKFDAQSFLRVHEFLFEEVYDWAGQFADDQYFQSRKKCLEERVFGTRTRLIFQKAWTEHVQL